MGAWRHVVVGFAILLCAGLAFIGLLGGGWPEKHFDAKQITVTPAGDDGLRIREVVDFDFGRASDHGYQRIIPNDFGVPTDVSASSPGAPDDVEVVRLSSAETRIRIGDPNQTVTGQHRYVLEYTLPAARLSDGELALDLVGAGLDELQTDRFTVIVTGLELADPVCSVGAADASGGCTLALDAELSEPGAPVYRAEITPLHAYNGVTIGGTVVGRTEPVDIADPPLPPNRPDFFPSRALAMVPLGLLGAGVVYWLVRRAGRNEVFAGGAAEAAYGELPSPGPDGVTPSMPVTLVPDSRMDELATIEFVPPKGLRPWEGRALLTERVDDNTVSAWFSDLVAREIVTAEDDDDTIVLGTGPKRHHADPVTASHLDGMFDGSGELRLDKYDADFAGVWRAVKREQNERVFTSGWWRRLPPSAGPGGAVWLVVVVFALFAFGAGAVVSAMGGLVRTLPAAFAFGIVVPAVTAFVVYRTLLASRSATGSALALRTESFRRFLDASEGRHVEWAWSQGLLREYSAWAVALDEAEAWSRALEAANIPEPQRVDTSPLLLYSMASSLHSARTPPSSSGGSGGGFSGGGFSGGSVGGGGGGGSSGSW